MSVLRMISLKFEIEEVVKHPAGSRKILLRNTVEYNDSLQFPFDRVVSLFKMLFPSKELVFNFYIH